MHSGYLKVEIYRTLENIDKFLDKLDSYEYYSDNPQKIISVFKQFINILKENFEAIPDNKEFYTTLLQALNYQIIPLLRYISRSQSSDIPWSLIPNIQKIIKELVGDNYLIMIRPQWHWNYGVLISDIIHFLNGLLRFLTLDVNIRIDSPPIHVISFPYLEKNNFLLHSIIGHELGHFIQQEYFDEVFTTEWETKMINESMKDLISRQGKFGELFTKQRSKIQLTQEAREIILIYKGFVREIIPDIVGYLIFGPSQLFSLYFMTAWNEDDTLPSQKNFYYPPLKYRIRNLKELFLSKIFDEESKSNYNKILNDFDKELKNYLNEENDLQNLSNSEESDIAFKHFKEDLNNIFEYLLKRVGISIYNPAPEKIDKLILKLRQVIPPNEINNIPVTLADLFLSGWLFFYSDLNTKDDDIIKNHAKDYTTNYMILSKLLLKASTSIFIHSYYLENKEN
jgi:hypothetical protein